MDAVHWKKIQRVTPWLLPTGRPPEREYIVPHETMVDVTQTMACIQCGACVSDCLSMEVDPLFIGPAALAKAYRFVGDPRDGQHYERLKDLAEDPHGIYDCTHCFNCIEACPKGVAPMNQIMRLRRIAGDDDEHRGPQQRLPPRARVRREHPRRTGCSTRPTCCPTPTAASSNPRAVPELLDSLPVIAARRCARGKVTPQKAPAATSTASDLEGRPAIYREGRGAATSASSSTSTSPATRRTTRSRRGSAAAATSESEPHA